MIPRAASDYGIGNGGEIRDGIGVGRSDLDLAGLHWFRWWWGFLEEQTHGIALDRPLFIFPRNSAEFADRVGMGAAVSGERIKRVIVSENGTQRMSSRLNLR